MLMSVFEKQKLLQHLHSKWPLFQSVLPSVGIAALSAKEAEGRTNISAGEKVSVDVFITTQNPAKLYNDLRWNLTRPQGFEVVMRVRCIQGLQVQEYSGNFCKRIPTDVDLPAIDCDKTIMVTLKHDDKLQDGTECSFQCALRSADLDT
ncbi:hypothetical protein L2E82_47798 [Cichorium intybus]|uniref:Uncharacterized protein n=1 Tax=Cichorium intybus TaxID=13427 RepID=A0ACB8YWZ7_CICIN|nr:hypothetical protein L2E82_47798 [Cichorium intybus]